MILNNKITVNSDRRLFYTPIKVYSVCDTPSFLKTIELLGQSAAGRHLNASPFTLQTAASFRRMSDTTSLCRSNLGFNLSMGIQFSPCLALVKIRVVWPCRREAAPAGRCPSRHHVTESSHVLRLGAQSKRDSSVATF